MWKVLFKYTLQDPLSSRGVPFTRREDPYLIRKKERREGLFDGPELFHQNSEKLFPSLSCLAMPITLCRESEV